MPVVRPDANEAIAVQRPSVPGARQEQPMTFDPVMSEVDVIVDAGSGGRARAAWACCVQYIGDCPAIHSGGLV